MSKLKLNRRQFVTNTGVVFTLPLLESLVPKALAAVAADPRRFVGFYIPNGTYHRRNSPELLPWLAPLGPLTNNLGATFQPFANFRNDFTLIHNYRIKAYNQGSGITGTTHLAGPICYFTQAENKSRPSANCTSFEHLVAAKLGRPALVIHSGSNFIPGADTATRCSSFLNGQERMDYVNPGDLYRFLLGRMIAPAGLQSQSLVTRTLTGTNNRSILNNVMGDINALKNQVGKTDRQRLDEYFENIRILEQKFGAGPAPGPTPTPIFNPGPAPTPTPEPIPNPPVTPGAACVTPTLPAGVDTGKIQHQSAGYLARFKAFNDLIKIAFACDISRSATIMFDAEAYDYPNLIAPADMIYKDGDITGKDAHIQISHAVGSEKGKNMSITRDRMVLTLVFDLISKLKSGADPSGSPILDNTIIFGGHGLPEGTHSEASNNNISLGHPAMLAGGRNFMKPGFCIDGTTWDQGDLFYTFNSILGLGLSNFGGATKIVPI